MRIPREHRKAYHDAKLDYVATGRTDNDYLDFVLHKSSDSYVGRLENPYLNEADEVSKERHNTRNGSGKDWKRILSTVFRFERIVRNRLTAEGSKGRIAIIPKLPTLLLNDFRLDLRSGPLYVLPVNLDATGRPRIMFGQDACLIIGSVRICTIERHPNNKLGFTLNHINHVDPVFQRKMYLYYLTERKQMIEGYYDTSFFQRTIESIQARPDGDWQDH